VCGQDPSWTFSTAFGKEQYSAPDFLADGLFDLAWPGYRNAGYYRDASFELSPTPFGDVFDVLLSDVSTELLSRYLLRRKHSTMSFRDLIFPLILDPFMTG